MISEHAKKAVKDCFEAANSAQDSRVGGSVEINYEGIIQRAIEDATKEYRVVMSRIEDILCDNMGLEKTPEQKAMGIIYLLIHSFSGCKPECPVKQHGAELVKKIMLDRESLLCSPQMDKLPTDMCHSAKLLKDLKNRVAILEVMLTPFANLPTKHIPDTHREFPMFEVNGVSFNALDVLRAKGVLEDKDGRSTTV